MINIKLATNNQPNIKVGSIPNQVSFQPVSVPISAPSNQTQVDNISLIAQAAFNEANTLTQILANTTLNNIVDAGNF